MMIVYTPGIHRSCTMTDTPDVIPPLEGSEEIVKEMNENEKSNVVNFIILESFCFIAL